MSYNTAADLATALKAGDPDLEKELKEAGFLKIDPGAIDNTVVAAMIEDAERSAVKWDVQRARIAAAALRSWSGVDPKVVLGS
tara:strand:+ start:3967 stop:4215 length:249 start_codon:yes stop_codon:yes gene_type:complete